MGFQKKEGVILSVAHLNRPDHFLVKIRGVSNDGHSSLEYSPAKPMALLPRSSLSIDDHRGNMRLLERLLVPDVGVQLLTAPATERRRPGIDWLYRPAVCLLQPIFYVTKVVKHVQSSRPAKDLWVGLNRYHLLNSTAMPWPPEGNLTGFTVTRRLMGIPPC